MANLEMSHTALMLSLGLVVIPVTISLLFKLRLSRFIIWATIRMAVQLLLVGLFLKYLFDYNLGWLNLTWLLVMVTTAVFSAVKSCALSIEKIFWPTFTAFALTTLLIMLLVNGLILRLDHLLDARYLVVLGGMILGNALRSNIVGLASFYQSVKKDEKHYLYTLSLGLSAWEAQQPYLRESLLLAIQPTLATMTTMGIVALPGIMTGVILGGVDPTMAVRYQLMIMLAILSSSMLSLVATVLLSLKTGFTPTGMLRPSIFN